MASNILHKLTSADYLHKNLTALKQELKGQWWQITQPNTPDPIFIIGCSRSGTTVTFETLGESNEVVSLGYETPQLWHKLHGPQHNQWHSEAATAEDAQPAHRNAYFKHYYQRLSHGQILDKTCINILRLPYLYQLFPNAKFVFLYRNGRDNISSLMDGWRNHNHFGLNQFLGASPEPVNIEHGEFNQWHFFLPPQWRDYNQSSLAEVCAMQWLSANNLALEAKQLIPPQQWVELQYEQFIAQPVAQINRVCQQLELNFNPQMQRHCEQLSSRPTSMVSGKPEPEKWKKRNYDAIVSIQDTIAPLMQKLGYE
ncbi:sulfotransferase [Motilimonas sp. 1_MG-2023]|uniref:sulfotransferase family protein n=1 Tax=Motilimonas sp. 1_MG-2023 TaxID=3062672 RepID=UPI0026E28FF1|nr:sulfotransferase [Motilimonas sp. 1_MG-2023]MDO6524840.1 sulfotransferase [Motilimonas sp. 1_MG-2023]